MTSAPIPNPICRAARREVVDVPWGQFRLSASGSLGISTSMTFARVTIHAGQENPRHRHPNCEEILHLLSGRLVHTLGKERFVLEPGDTISIPKGIWHQAISLGGDDAEIVICFSSPDRITEIDESED